MMRYISRNHSVSSRVKKSIVLNKYDALYARQAGVTLIEALIALLIFSVGALGLAAMQLNALSASGGSQQRSIVLWKAQDLADRIRSNSNLAQAYVDRIGNANLNTIGTDSLANVIICGQGQYVQPAAFCSDTVNNAAANCNDVEKVNFDVWEVFCEASTGPAVTAIDANNLVADGSVGLINLEVALIQNSFADGDPDNDMLLYFEWASRSSDSNAGVAGANQPITTTLCGVNQQVAANLETYCLRFNP